MYKISVTQTTQLFSRPDSLMSIVSLTLVRSCQTASNYTSLSFFLVLFHRMSVFWHSSVGGSETGVHKVATGSSPQWLCDGPQLTTETILSAVNSGKPLSSWSSATNPAGELTALPDLTAGGKGVAAPSPGTSPPFSAFGHAPMKKPGLATVLKGIWPVKEFSCISNPERARSLEGLCGRPEEIPQRNRPIKHKLKAAW